MIKFFNYNILLEIRPYARGIQDSFKSRPGSKKVKKGPVSKKKKLYKIFIKNFIF
jgi:hypothetical protein